MTEEYKFDPRNINYEGMNPESAKFLRRATENMLSGNNPFDRLIDNSAEKIANVLATLHGIIKYAEAMAQVLAQAALASQKATGDDPDVALGRWMGVIQNRAHNLIREAQSGEPKDLQKAITGSGGVPDEP